VHEIMIISILRTSHDGEELTCEKRSATPSGPANRLLPQWVRKPSYVFSSKCQEDTGTNSRNAELYEAQHLFRKFKVQYAKNKSTRTVRLNLVVQSTIQYVQCDEVPE